MTPSQNDYIKKLCQELEDHSQSNSSRNLFRSVKDLTGKSTARLAVIKDEDGKILTESEEIRDRWKRYCEELYASQETDGVPDNTDEDSCEMSQTYSGQRLPMPFNILRTTSHQALMKFLLS